MNYSTRMMYGVAAVSLAATGAVLAGEAVADVSMAAAPLLLIILSIYGWTFRRPTGRSEHSQ